MYPPVDAPPILDGPVLNPEPMRRTEGAQRLAAELLDAALELPAPEAAERINRAAGMLHSLDPLDVRGDDNRIAFWLNLHNALERHARFARLPGAGRAFAKTAAYRVGTWRYSLDLIVHGLFRANARPPWSLFRAARRGDPRLQAAPSRADARVLAALGSPRHFLSGQIDRELDEAVQSRGPR